MKILVALAFLASTFTVVAQQSYLIDAKKSTMELSGQTNLSSWDEQVMLFKGSLKVDKQPNELTSISNLELQIPVNGIEAPRKGMQKDTYEALKEEEHPEITFVATEIIVKAKSVFITGNLAVAGNSKSATIQCEYNLNEEEISLKGSYRILMSDYGVIPPKAMLGTLQVEELVNITFNLIFVRS